MQKSITKSIKTIAILQNNARSRGVKLFFTQILFYVLSEIKFYKKKFFFGCIDLWNDSGFQKNIENMNIYF